MQKKLIVLQDGNKECGSASLLSIIRYYGGNISINKLVEMTKTDKNGTNFYNIKQASQQLGINSLGYKIDNIDKLFNIKEPFLCQLINQNYTHFVVVYKINKDKVILMDPAKGKVVKKTSLFSKLMTGYIMLFEPYKTIPIIKSNNHINNIIIKTLIKNRKYIINIFLLSIIFTILTCIYSFYFQLIIDKIIDTNYLNLIILTIVFGVIVLIKNISNYFRNKLLIYLNQKLDLSIILLTFNKILLLPYNYYKNKTTGEVIARINDLANIKNILNQLIVSIFLDLLILIGAGIILFTISKSLFLTLFILAVIYILLIYLLRPIIKEKVNINQENNAKINSFLVESISSYETIKGLNIESKIERKMEDIYISSLNDTLSYNKLVNTELFLKDIIEALGTLLIVFVGSKLVMNKQLTLGSLITFYSLIVYFLNPVRNIIDLNKEYHYAINSLKRANNLFDIEIDNLDKTNNLLLTGDIKLQNLTFSYNEKKKVLNNINLSIKAGEKVLILGSSGSGKSTLLKILFKYHKVNRGQVIINNEDINDYTLRDIRKNTTYISQNEMLYTNTIRNNILLNRDIKEYDFLNICRLTSVDDIVKDMFLGYDTPLEENAFNISGGQRQRIILARALLKESNLIMIDEGLNEIDINLERKILKQVFSYYNKKTFIIVSHRLDNIDLYDKVIKIKNNKLLEVITKNRRIDSYG